MNMDPNTIRNFTEAMQDMTAALNQFSRAGVNTGAVMNNMKGAAKETNKLYKEMIEDVSTQLGKLEDIEDALKNQGKEEAKIKKFLQAKNIADKNRIKNIIKLSKLSKKELNDNRRALKRELDDKVKAQKIINDIEKKQETEEARRREKQSKEDEKAGKKKKVPGERGFTRRSFSGRRQLSTKGMHDLIDKAGVGTARTRMLGTAADPLRLGLGNKSINPFKIGGTVATGRERAGEGAESMKAWKKAFNEKKSGYLLQARKHKGTAEGAKYERLAKSMGNAAKMAGTLSTGLNTLAKSFWPLAIATALAGIVRTAKDLQKWLTELNKKFLEFAGPTVGIGNIPKEMKVFNKEIFNLQRNLKLGLKAGDIQEMFSAMSGAGLSLTGVKEKAGSYGKAIYDARALSLEFGTSLSDMGKMVAEGMIDLKGSLEDVGDSFRAIAYDASKAGISSTKFYQSVEGSSAQLSYFGNYLKNVSGTLSSFLETSQMGFKDAEKATQDLYSAFSGMDFGKGMKLLNVLEGGQKGQAVDFFKEIQKKSGEDLTKKRSDLATAQKALATAPEAERAQRQDEVTKLMKELQLEERRQGQLDTAITKAEAGHFEEMALQIGRLAETPMDVVDAIRKIAGPYLPAQLTYLQQILGVSQETAYKILNNSDLAKDSFKQFVDGNKKTLEVFGKNTKAVEILQTAFKEGKKGKDIADLMIPALKKAGMDDETIVRFTSELSSQLTSNMGGPISALLDQLVKGQPIDMEKLFKEVNKAIQGGTSVDAKALKMTDKRLSEIVNRTTSVDDYMQIMKESATYYGADMMTTALMGATGILQKILEILSFWYKDTNQKELTKNKDIIEVLAGNIRKTKDYETRRDTLKSEFSNLYKGITGKELTEEEFTRYRTGLGKANIKKEKFDFGLGKDKNEQLTNAMSKYISNTEDYMKAKQNVTMFSKMLKKENANASLMAAEERAMELPVSELGSSDEDAALLAQRQEALKNAVKEGALSSNKDFRPTRGGLALLDKEDLVFKPAAGVGKSSGGFIPEVIDALLGGAGGYRSPLLSGGARTSSYQINLGGITINGDVEDPATVRRLGEQVTNMVRQEITKFEYQKNTARG